MIDAEGVRHGEVRAYIRATREVLLVPITVLPEADYLLTRSFGGHIALAMLQSVARGEFELENLTNADFNRSIELVEQYADSDIGLADASLVAIAERLRITRVLTLDHRHFRMFRPKHCPAFELVP
jgi:predicted nucleic acid-binding protein